MKLEVHIKDKIFTVHCGDGKQKIQYKSVDVGGSRTHLS